MSDILQLEASVLPGHRIEIQSPELPEGRSVTVLVLIDGQGVPRRRLSEVLGDYPGGQLFRIGEEVDAYLREERASWDG